jgi:hypothetical protein
LLCSIYFCSKIHLLLRSVLLDRWFLDSVKVFCLLCETWFRFRFSSSFRFACWSCFVFWRSINGRIKDLFLDSKHWCCSPILITSSSARLQIYYS